MPRQSILTEQERAVLLTPPETRDELIRHYSFSEKDLTVIRQRRGDGNRIGFATLLCYMRYPGVSLGQDEHPHSALLEFVAAQLGISTEKWHDYGLRLQTRREHLLELQAVFGFMLFGTEHYHLSVGFLEDLAWQTDKGIVLAEALIQHLRSQSILLPANRPSI